MSEEIHGGPPPGVPQPLSIPTDALRAIVAGNRAALGLPPQEAEEPDEDFPANLADALAAVEQERDKYRDILERLADEDAWVLDEGLSGGHQEEHHVRANLAKQALGQDVCGCTECQVSLGLEPDDDEADL